MILISGRMALISQILSKNFQICRNVQNRFFFCHIVLILYSICKVKSFEGLSFANYFIQEQRRLLLLQNGGHYEISDGVSSNSVST